MAALLRVAGNSPSPPFLPSLSISPSFLFSPSFFSLSIYLPHRRLTSKGRTAVREADAGAQNEKQNGYLMHPSVRNDPDKEAVLLGRSRAWCAARPPKETRMRVGVELRDQHQNVNILPCSERTTLNSHHFATLLQETTMALPLKKTRRIWSHLSRAWCALLDQPSPCFTVDIHMTRPRHWTIYMAIVGTIRIANG